MTMTDHKPMDNSSSGVTFIIIYQDFLETFLNILRLDNLKKTLSSVKYLLLFRQMFKDALRANALTTVVTNT